MVTLIIYSCITFLKVLLIPAVMWRLSTAQPNEEATEKFIFVFELHLSNKGMREIH